MEERGLGLPSAAVVAAVAAVCDRDRDFLQIEQLAGTLSVRREGASFASLVRIVVGQQLSAKAAESIFLRLKSLVEVTPIALLNAEEELLRQAGLSRAKVVTCRELAIAILDGRLDLANLETLSDEAVTAELTKIKGIGPWTAQIFLLFCMERLDSFPAADLAVQVAYQRLKGLEQRPTAKELLVLCEDLKPWRGAVAHLLWHYYRYLSGR
jgi:DNA-3-methyladenine glycosylase II